MNPFSGALLTLAAGWGEILFLIIVAVVGLVQYILKQAKQADQERRRRQTLGSSSPSSTTGTIQTDQPIDPIEQLRRQRLGSSSARSKQPNNLTLQQMKARAQAKAIYEKRAAELRHRQAPLLAQSQVLVKRSEPSLAGPADRPVQRTLRKKKQSMAPSSVTGVGPDHGQIDTGESVVHRHVPDAPLPPSTSFTAQARGGAAAEGAVANVAAQVARPATRKISRTTLRRAMMLKEILDPPLAMRQM